MIVVVGEVDAHSVDLLAAQQHDVVRIRLTKCNFMDSSGLRALLVAYAVAASRGARLVAVEPSDVASTLHDLWSARPPLDRAAP